MIHRCVWALFLLSGCSSGGDVHVDYTVTFTDGAGKNLGVVDSGSFDSVQASAPTKALQFSMATLDIKSDMNGLHFVVTEDMSRRGALTCIAQNGTSSAFASAEVSSGGHYLVSVNAKGAHCFAEQ